MTKERSNGPRGPGREDSALEATGGRAPKDRQGAAIIPLRRPGNGGPRRTALRRHESPRSPAHARLEALLGGEGAEAKVQALSPVDLSRLIRSVGLGSAHELLALCQPEQVRGVVDLHVWQRDRLDLPELLDWVTALAILPDEARQRAVASLDIELLAFLLRSSAEIYLVAEEEAPADLEGFAYETPDGWFVVDIDAAPEQAEQIKQFVAQLYADDADQARRLLLNLRWETPSELEEWSLRWRNARLEDLGFTDQIEALAVYAYLDPGSIGRDEHTADRLPVADPEPLGQTELALLHDPGAQSFWAQTLARVDDPAEHERIGRAALLLANRTLSADRIDPADTEGGQESLERLHWRLSLGLEHLAGGDPAQGLEILGRVALVRIARVGHSLLLELRRALLPLARACLIGPRPLSAAWLDSPLGEQVEGLLGLQPRFYDLTTQALRTFRDRHDLAAARQWVEQAVAATELVRREARPLAEEAKDAPTLGNTFRTEVAARLLGATRPPDREGIRTLVAQFRERGPAAPGWVLDTAATVARERLGGDSLPEPAAQVVESWTALLVDELAHLQPEAVDPRFISF